MSDQIPLNRVRVLGPWQKTEHHLVFPNETVKILGFYGLPKGLFIDSVKIGLISFAETGALGKVVHPAQPLVITLESKCPLPLALDDTFMEVEKFAKQERIKEEACEAKEPACGKDTTLLRFSLLFGGGIARVGFRTRDLCTLEEIWTEGAELERAVIMGSHFHHESVSSWKGMVMSENTPVELSFTPRSGGVGGSGSSRAKAIVRMEKLVFPKKR